MVFDVLQLIVSFDDTWQQTFEMYTLVLLAIMHLGLQIQNRLEIFLSK